MTFKRYSYLVIGAFLFLSPLWGCKQEANEAKASSPVASATDTKQACQEAGGTWKTFPNTCANTCRFEENKLETLCGQAITESCDCGPAKCWDTDQHTCRDIKRKP